MTLRALRIFLAYKHRFLGSLRRKLTRGGDRDLQHSLQLSRGLGSRLRQHQRVFFSRDCFAQARFDISKLLPSSHLVWV